MANKDSFRLPYYPIADPRPNPYLQQLNQNKYVLNNDARQKFWNYSDGLEIDYKYVTQEFLKITPPINKGAQNILTDIFITKKIPEEIVSEDIQDKLIILMLIYKGTRSFPIQYHMYSLLRHLDYTNWGWGDYFRVGSNVPKTSEWLKKAPRYATGGKKNTSSGKKKTGGTQNNTSDIPSNDNIRTINRKTQRKLQ